MTDQPTGRFAALINAMTGEWSARPGRLLVRTDYLNPNGWRTPQPSAENAAGIAAAIALARLMVSERAVEIMARATYGGPDWDFANQNIRDFRVQRARAAIAAILKEVEG
jgi:hypothetical protein